MQQLITAIRTERADRKTPPGKVVDVAIVADAAFDAFLADHIETIKRLAKAGSVTRTDIGLVAGAEVHLRRGTVTASLLDSAVAVDLSAECARIGAETEKIEALADAQERKLGNEQFVARAPAAIVDKEREKLVAWRAQAQVLRERRRALGCAD